MRAAPLVADPAGDADREAHLADSPSSSFAVPGEAMRDAAARQLPSMLAQDGDEILVRVALMQEHRLADPRGDLELTSERGALHVARREIAKVVEPAFAHRDDFGRLRRALPAPRKSAVSSVA